jgi:hypothetical protein
VGISGFPAGSSGSSLGEALGAVLPAVQYLPLSTKGLNKCLYAPKKDYETEQVPPYSTQNVKVLMVFARAIAHGRLLSVS